MSEVSLGHFELLRMQDAPRKFVLHYGGKIVGRFTTQAAAQDELERLSRMDMKRGWLPKSFRIETV